MPGKHYIGMVGYTDEGKTFMWHADMDTKDARDIAGDNDLSEYWLVPKGKPFDHLGYIRVAPGRYKKTFTRIAVFKHLLDNKIDWIPTDEELDTGEKLDRSG